MTDRLDSWIECLHIGISRCNTLDMLNRYYLRWVDEIRETGRMSIGINRYSLNRHQKAESANKARAAREWLKMDLEERKKRVAEKFAPVGEKQ